MYNEETGEYDTIVPEDENLNTQVDLSGYSDANSNPTWAYGSNPNAQPTGSITPQQAAQSIDSSQNSRGRGDQLGMSDVWQRTTASILQSLAQTGINVYAQRNGVYAGQVPNTQQGSASPRQRQQSMQPMIMLALVIGAVYVLGKK